MTINDDDLRMLDEWRSECISEADFATLQLRLSEDAGLRGELRALADLEEGLASLAWRPIAIDPIAAHFDDLLPLRERTSFLPANEDHRGRLRRGLPWAITAVAAVLAMVGWIPKPDTKKPPAVRSVTALLVDEAGAEFAQPRQPGEVRFDPGSYELLAGTVHLRFANGADLVVQGPARFDIRDESHTQLAFGRVRAIVPPTARGFTLETKEVHYEDIGTEFGLSVDASTGASAMHVFDGQVNLHRAGATGLIKSVFEGDGVQCRDGRLDAAADLDLNQFPSPDEIGFLRWKSLHQEMLSDPSLIAWFPFARADNASILTNAQRARGLPDGRIAGAQWTTGRWAGKQALLFDRDSDFAEFEIPGEFQELSIAAWLKVDRFDWEMNAICNSNGSDSGDVHFQMTRHGLPRGGVLGPDRGKFRWVGNPVPLAKWVYVVSVLSMPQRRSVIYVNGEPVWEYDFKSNAGVLILPGHCRLGNWLQEGVKYGTSPRALRGVIDEVAIWNRALSQTEVLSQTEKGRPSLLWSRENPPPQTPMPIPNS